MRPIYAPAEMTTLESAVSVCCGSPRGDELPQVAGLEDILRDVYSDILNVPHEYASDRFHHQYDDDFEDVNGLIH